MEDPIDKIAEYADLDTMKMMRDTLLGKVPDDFKKMTMENPSKKISELAAEIIKLHEEGGKQDEEIRCIDSMIQLDDRVADHFFPWLLKGILFGVNKNYEESVKCFDKAIELGCSDIFELWYGKAMSLAELGKYEEALTCCEKAVALDHTDFDDSILEDLWYLKGQIHLHMRQSTKAITCYSKVTELNPNHDYAWDNMGNMFNELGNQFEALECFEKSINANPTGEGWYNKGNTLRRLDRDVDAIECFDQATKIHPTDPDGWLELAHCFYNTGKPEEAIKCFDKIIELDPKNPGAVFKNMAEIWWNKFQIISRYQKVEGKISKKWLECIIKYFRVEPDRELVRTRLESIKLFDPILGDDLDKNLSDDEIMNKTINRWKQEAEKEQEAENS